MDTITLENVDGMSNNNFSRTASLQDRLARLVEHLAGSPAVNADKLPDPAPHPSMLHRTFNNLNAADIQLTSCFNMIEILENILSITSDKAYNTLGQPPRSIPRRYQDDTVNEAMVEKMRYQQSTAPTRSGHATDR